MGLPAPIAPFVGRGDELAALEALLRSGARLLTLVGPAGIGKTRLAVQVAGDTGTPVGFVALGGVDQEVVGPAILRQCEVQELPGVTTAERLAASIGSQSLLLVIDGCEAAAAEVAAIVERVLLSCPELRVLATSRQALGVAGERVWPVPPLAEATSLFADRARAARPDFDADGAAASSVVRICDALDRLPLAIELAAAQVRLRTVEEIVIDLDDTLVLLDGDASVAAPRSRSVRAAIGSSYDRLPPALQRAFNRLSVFSGSFDAGAASAVAGVEADAVRGLVERSLVEAFTDEQATTFRLLRTVRAFAHERLAESDDVDDARRALLSHVAAAVSELSRHDHAANVAKIRAWADQIDDALAAAELDPPAALDLVGALWGHWLLTGQLARGRRWAEHALAVGAAESPVRRAAALHTLAWMLEMQGDVIEAHAAAVKGLRMVEDYASPTLRARLLLKVAWPEQMWDRARALERFHEVLEASAPADAITRSCAHFFLAFALMEADPREAREHTAAAVRLAATGNPMLLPHLDLCRGWWALLEGDTVRAVELAEGAARIFRSRGDQYWWIATSMAGAVVRIETDHVPEAIATLAEVAAATDDLGQPWLGVGAASALARAHLLTGELGEARRLVDSAIAASDTVGVLPPQRARLLAVRAELLLAAGEPRAADGAARDAVKIAASAGLLPLPGDPEVTAARVARALGDWERAMRLAASAIERVREHDVRIGGPEALEAVSDLLADAGEHDRAARLAATALALRVEMGLRVARTTPAEAEPMTLDRAIADALRRRGRRGRPRSGWDALTPAEREVVDLVAEGLPNKEIATQLRVSPRTVSTHLSRVFTKLDVRNRAELAAARVRHLADDPSG